jgi:hypothetical protein
MIELFYWDYGMFLLVDVVLYGLFGLLCCLILFEDVGELGCPLIFLILKIVIILFK